SRHAPRADDGARSHDPRILGPPPGADRAGVVRQAAAVHLGDRLRVRPLGHRRRGRRLFRLPRRARRLCRQAARVPRLRLPRRRADARRAGGAAALRVAPHVISPLALDIAHLFAGGLVLVSVMLLYQDRMTGLINTFALHALVVSMSVAWQALIQHAPHLYITAAIALVIKAVVIPVALRRMVVRLGIHRTIEPVVSIGLTMLAAIGLIALSIMVMLPITAQAGTLAREDLSFALSVILLGLLMMISRRNAVSQVIGFMSIENGLILAATGAKGMPLVVEISVAFSILVALIVIGIFL